MTQELSANTSLSHYRVVSKIGAGGMGEVYLAEDDRLRRKVALKVLPESLSRDADRLSRFEQEAFAASALNHPNILTIHELGVDGDTHFLASEFVDGETLRERLNRAPLSVDEALEIAVQTTQALAAAHEAHIVHRDIKPENVMLRRDGIVKVLDFGLAKFVESAPSDSESETRKLGLTQAGTVMGTVAYMSPEQARGLPVDARTDIFSLGVMLYEMLAGRQPFTGETINHVIVAIIEKEPPPLPSDIPAELTGILQHALAKNVEERFASAREVLAELKKLRMRLLVEAEHSSSSISNVPTESQPTTLPPVTSNRLVRRAAPWLVAGLLVLVGGLFTYRLFSTTDNQIESIAVMPFVNASGNEEAEYLSDGMTETLISNLSRLPKLNVKARSTVFRYKGKELDPSRIARELKVQAILTGRVVQRGEQLTLSLELVDARTENAVWSEQYNRRQTDLVTLQTEIARDVSRKLKSKLAGEDIVRVEKNANVHPEAYQLYLKGLFQSNLGSAEGLKQAEKLFMQAIAKDPNYAPAHAALGKTALNFPFYSIALPKDSFPRAKAEALRALELDDSLADAHVVLGMILAVSDWDFTGAEKELRRAIELEPTNPFGYSMLGLNLAHQKRFDEAIAAVRHAVDLDPLSRRTRLAELLLFSHRPDEAIAEMNAVLQFDRDFPEVYWFLGEGYFCKGSYQEAISAFQKTLELDDDPAARAYLALALAKAGNRDAAARELERLQLEATKRYIPGYAMGLAFLAVGKKDEALTWIEKDVADRTNWAMSYSIDPMLDGLRNEPRFQAMLKRMNVP